MLMLGAFAHVSDVTSPHIWTARMGLLEFMFLGGLAAGRGLSVPLFKIAGQYKFT